MDYQKTLKTIKQNNTFLISSHVNPDPDALAAELVMALYLKSIGKKVFIINADEVPERFKFLPGIKLVKPIKERQRLNYDVAIVVDCGDLNRIGPVKRIVTCDKPLINIDHHITNDLFGDLNMVNPKASSTAEVIYSFLKQARFVLTKDIAILTYVGIMTDTGSFRYESTTAHTHAIVSELMRFGFSVSELYRKLYESIPLNDLRNFAKVVHDLTPMYGGKVICLELRKSVVRKFSEEFDLRDKIFRYLRAVKGVDVFVILTEFEKDRTRVNFRSHSKVNVAQIAFYFNGGGHSRASGCVVDGDLKTARGKVLRQIEKTLKNS